MTTLKTTLFFLLIACLIGWCVKEFREALREWDRQAALDKANADCWHNGTYNE